MGILVTCLTTSEGACKSIKRLWMRISKRSQVFVLSTGSLTGGNLQLLGGKTNGSTDMELLVQRGLLQVSADLLQVLHIARGQGNADAVDHLIGWGRSCVFLWWVSGHDPM